jgi:hypothetical protein
MIGESQSLAQLFPCTLLISMKELTRACYLSLSIHELSFPLLFCLLLDCILHHNKHKTSNLVLVEI